MAVLGLGLGMVMQVLILAVQNDAPYEDLGVATAGATLFRSIGGSLGTATLGAVFTNRLIDRAELPACRPAPARARTRGASTRRRWPPCRGRCTTPTSTASPARSPRSSWSRRRSRSLAFALTWLIREVPLRTTLRDEPRASEPPVARPRPAPEPARVLGLGARRRPHPEGPRHQLAPARAARSAPPHQARSSSRICRAASPAGSTGSRPRRTPPRPWGPARRCAAAPPRSRS